MKFIVIGISDAPEPSFSSEVLEVIKQGKIFSGGKRHHEIVASLLPADALWIDITTPLDAVFLQYQSLTSDIIVFASGTLPHLQLPTAVGPSLGDTLPRYAYRLTDRSPLA